MQFTSKQLKRPRKNYRVKEKILVGALFLGIYAIGLSWALVVDITPSEAQISYKTLSNNVSMQDGESLTYRDGLNLSLIMIQ